MTADGLQEKPRPFSRLLESVERARAAREGSSADKANKITNRGTPIQNYAHTPTQQLLQGGLGWEARVA